MTSHRPQEGTADSMRRWIIPALAIAGLLWAAASWYAGVNAHLSLIDIQLKVEDQKLNWLVQHNPSAKDAPMSWLQSPVTASTSENELTALGQDDRSAQWFPYQNLY